MKMTLDYSFKSSTIHLFLGGIAASGNNVYKGGRYKLPEWHQLYGKFLR